MTDTLTHLTFLNEEGSRRLKDVRTALTSVRLRLAKSPAGKIRIARKSSGIQFFIRKDPKDKCGAYLSKKDKKTVCRYLQKYYDEKLQKLLSEENMLLSEFLKKEECLQKQIEAAYSCLDKELKDHILPIDMSDDDYAAIWAAESFTAKELQNERTVFQTFNGEYVRSKSELTIANTLFQNDIPYKYECPVKLKSGIIFHPDFTVLNKRKREVIYWEHRGMMDDRDYSRHAVQKSKEYAKNGFIFGQNLIFTEETSINPLSTSEIEMIIKNFLI